MSNFISNFIRKSVIRNLLKDVQSETLSRFERIELMLDGFQAHKEAVPDGRDGLRPRPKSASHPYDLIVTNNEICPRHGTGVLLMRLFGESEHIINLRSQTHFKSASIGEVQLELKQAGHARLESFLTVARVLRHYPVKRILCVPFVADDLITAIAAHELFKAPLCLYLMDDQNIHAAGIPDDLMKEAIGKARLRLAIGPEMRAAYEKKFGQKFWIVPPVVPAKFIGKPKAPVKDAADACALVGNIWSAGWLSELRRAIRQSGITVHWYGNSAAHIPAEAAAEWAKDGIHARGFLDEEQLLCCLQDYPCAIVPMGSPKPNDSHQWQAEMSIPSRIPFLMAAANIPVLVLTTKDNPAANFVRRFRIGEVCDYSPANIRAAVAAICAPPAQEKYRANAAQIAGLFSAEGVGDWIWRSLELGMACDDRFEGLFK